MELNKLRLFMMRNFNWKILFLFCIPTVLVAILTTETFAYLTYESVQGGGASCSACHFGFQDSGPLHEQHLSLNVGCYRCHKAHRIDTESKLTVTTTSLSIDGNRGCVGCHGRSEDAGFDLISDGLGAGLRQHHYNSGEESCQICHRDSVPSSYSLVGEDVLPPFYITDGLNPCTDTLDNDGDLLDDGTDSDCVLNTALDEIPNFEDNCPNNCNTQQLDADGDGIGDVCDDTPGCGGCGYTICETEC